MAPKQPLERTDTEQMDEANANSHGNVFGGDILRSMDRYASWTAAAYAEEDVVTASITRMSFEEPVDTDDELVYETRVDYVGDTSLTVAVDVKVADTGTATASAYLTYVAQDDDGGTVTVPDLDLDTEDDEDRYEAAEAWKEEAKAHSRGSLPDPDDWDIEGTVTRMRPRHADEKDKVFGGAILSVMDEVASAAAERYAEESVVTASLDTMSFEEPVYTDDLLVMDANVDYVGSSSMVVAVDVHAEDAQEAEIRDTGSAYLTFVAVDDDGPMSVPSLDPDSDEEEERYEAAEAWKEKVLDDLSD